jgi:hypothetical protein
MKKSEIQRFQLIASFIFIFLLFLLPLVSSATVIQVQPPQEPQTTNPFANIGNFFKSSIFWGLIVILVLVVIFGIVAFLLVKWIINFIKEQNDIFYQIRKQRIKLASAQRRYKVNYSIIKFWNYKGNTPIRLARQRDDGTIHISKPICYYRGDFRTHEGNIVIAFNMKGNEIMWVFPKQELLIIPNREKITLHTKDGDGQTKEIVIDNLPTADKIVQFNENEILLFAEGLSNSGHFYIPVLKSKDGKMIDLSLPVYESLKEVALGNYLYEQTDAFVKVSKKGIELNPNLVYSVKAEPNSNVDVPTGSGGR